MLKELPIGLVKELPIGLVKVLPIGLVKVLNLLKKSFRWLVEGNYIIEEARKVLPPYFHDFFKINLTTKSKFLR